MSTSIDPIRGLNDCGCCEGISASTPAQVFNRPGLSAIAYRTGSHGHFKQTMLARLSGSALKALNTRDDSDFSIALLDAWATVADVLTFYQERIANESYLATATERLSVLEMARLIGYELRPGVAAGTSVAFTLEDAPGAFGQALNLSNLAQAVPEASVPITIEAGVRIQSVPGPGEEPAIFETIESIEARAEWNALKPRLKQPQRLLETMGSIVFGGTAASLKPGDTLLIVIDPSSNALRTILNVRVDDEANTTRVDFEKPALSPPSYKRPGGMAPARPSDFAPRTLLNLNTVRSIAAGQWNEEDLSALARMQNWSVSALRAGLNKQAAITKFTGGEGVFAFRQRCAIFGYNAPDYDLLTATLRSAQKEQSGGLRFIIPTIDLPEFEGRIGIDPSLIVRLPANWENRTLEMDSRTNGNLRTIDLDSAYPAIGKRGWLILTAPAADGSSHIEAFRIVDHIEIARSDYAISSRVSRLTVESDQPFNSDFKLRTTSALVQSELLPLSPAPILDVVQGNTITLDQAYLGLRKGQNVVLTGERDDLKGVNASELLTINEVVIEAGFTVLVFETSLVNSYVRASVVINANVARATHGESVHETLGGGDATQAFQRFTLLQPPLTYTSAPNSSGSQSTLEVRVNDLLWSEVPEFFGHDSSEHIYITRTDEEGRTAVIFGDGKTGARLPTGQENVKAVYRKGIGVAGLVREHQLSQVMTRPLGVKGVTNPIAASGAQDPEQLADARRNAPLTVLTLGRVVSLKDYEDFAAAFSGIGKSLATWSWSGEWRNVLLTVAGINGTTVEKETDLYKNLLSALRQLGDPYVPVLVESYEPRFFRFAATLQVEAGYLSDKVRAEVEALLRERFSFDARQFGQPVHQSEVIGLIQNVRGVLSVVVREFYRSDLEAGIEPRLAAALPRIVGETLIAAELLTLDPRPLQLEAVQ